MFFVGLDLGQKRDHSAIAVVEEDHGRLMLRHVERVALGTPYPEVVARVRRMVRSDALRGECEVVVDATGVGAPVVDLMRAAGLGCEVTAVTITSGMRNSGGDSAWSVPKGELVAGVQAALGQGRLRIARRMRGVKALLGELMDVRVRTGRIAGRVRVGADGYGKHDDLVMALALACWRAHCYD